MVSVTLYMTLPAKGISHTATYDACADHVGHNVCGHLQWKIATHVVPYVVCACVVRCSRLWDIPLAHKVIYSYMYLFNK